MQKVVCEGGGEWGGGQVVGASWESTDGGRGHDGSCAEVGDLYIRRHHERHKELNRN